MEQRRDGAMRNEYIEKMLKHLPVLRAAAGITQVELGRKIGVSRQTIVAIENGKRPLPWYLYLAMVLVFQQYEDSRALLESFELFDSDYIKNK